MKSLANWSDEDVDQMSDQDIINYLLEHPPHMDDLRKVAGQLGPEQCRRFIKIVKQGPPMQ